MSGRSLARAVGGAGLKLLDPLVAVLLALAVCAALIAAVGTNPLKAYQAMLKGSIGSIDSLAVTGVRMTPLLLAGLGVAVSFRAGIFNVGAEGQLYLGAVAATAVGLLPLDLPGWIHLPLTLLAGFAGGALWAAIPGYLRAYRGVSEVVLTLMLNYVGIQLASYMVDTARGPLGERGAAYSQSPPIPESALLPTLIQGTSLHGGLILGLVLAVAVFVLIQYTPFGFRLRMVGANPAAAEYAGVRAARQIVSVMAISGGLSGLAGASEVLGLKYRLYENFSPGYGYDAIAVALLARSDPLSTVLSAAFFGALRAGANGMQQVTGLEVSLVFIIQALTVLFAISGIKLARLGFGRKASRTRSQEGTLNAG